MPSFNPFESDPRTIVNSVIGWDIGGAHLKLAHLGPDGSSLNTHQFPCPLWQGLDQLKDAIHAALSSGAIQASEAIHAITMTGELVDLFENRHQGVMAIATTLADQLGENLWFFCGGNGFKPYRELERIDFDKIASANWMATGLWTARHIPTGLLIDIGSTTTDLLLFKDHVLLNRGYTDHERMRYDELVYTGIVRTPAMMLSARVPIRGSWIKPMAEHFASASDVYRVTGELEEDTDQMPTADSGPKTRAASQRRLARLFGLDSPELEDHETQQVAQHLRDQQLTQILDSARVQLSRSPIPDSAPIVGAGVGRFLVRALAKRLERPYQDFLSLFPQSGGAPSAGISHYAPAVSVACLLHSTLKQNDTAH